MYRQALSCQVMYRQALSRQVLFVRLCIVKSCSSGLVLSRLVSSSLVLSDRISSGLVASNLFSSGLAYIVKFCCYRSSTTWPIDLMDPYDLTHLVVLWIHLNPVQPVLYWAFCYKLILAWWYVYVSDFLSSLFCTCIRSLSIFMHYAALLLSHTMYKLLFSLRVAFTLHSFMRHILLCISQALHIHALQFCLFLHVSVTQSGASLTFFPCRASRQRQISQAYL